jgi:lipopolysaccharide export LptBFGC system permease protein LptF
LVIPLVVGIGASGVLKGLIPAFLVTTFFYSLHFLFMDLGQRGILDPIISAWLPTFLYLGAGATAFSRMKT